MLVQSCFANIYLLLVCRSRCRRLVILLKLPIVLIQKFCYHGNMTSLLSSLLGLSRFSSSFNDVITPASQWSANTHFTLPITPFVRYTSSAGHITSSLPLNWCNVSDNVLYLYCRHEFPCVAPFVSDLWAVSSSPLPFAQISACTLRTQGFSNFTFSVDKRRPFFLARLSFRLSRPT